jgi:hypothetical protein
VRRALSRVQDQVQARLCVVLDSCTDRTPWVVAGLLQGWPGAQVVTVRNRPPGAGVGLARDLGVRALLRGLRPRGAERVWLLNTDADTTVPAGWVLEQLCYARGGTHGVAGLADLRGEPRLSRIGQQRYREIASSGVRGGTHNHVYAANLGVRADAYLRCGGFPAWGHGEEHQLWRAMAEADCQLRQPSDLRVSTSARIRGRAEGGLADLLRSIDADVAEDPSAERAV